MLSNPSIIKTLRLILSQVSSGEVGDEKIAQPVHKSAVLCPDRRTEWAEWKKALTLMTILTSRSLHPHSTVPILKLTPYKRIIRFRYFRFITWKLYRRAAPALFNAPYLTGCVRWLGGFSTFTIHLRRYVLIRWKCIIIWFKNSITKKKKS